jgi:hypothetical protein
MKAPQSLFGAWFGAAATGMRFTAMDRSIDVKRSRNSRFDP